ncbi:hypothetical protein INT80_03250 [Gallibacterium anatis]|uniref:Uncharacterized protein n=1 Tax=Gallibacterium anatis TaxID=750 RepID=A0A930Y4V4_9PAST|nr:hypothetical protein [Gallibacterium anatis]
MSDLDDNSVYPTNNPIWNNAVNVGDLKAATDAARTEVTGTGEAFVTSKQATDGHTIYNVHVDKILSHKDAAGNELVAVVMASTIPMKRLRIKHTYLAKINGIVTVILRTVNQIKMHKR